MKAIYVSVILIFLVNISCGMLSGRETVAISLEEYTVSIEYAKTAMGDTDRVSAVYSGRTLKLGEDQTAMFESDSNLLSGHAYVYGGTYSLWLQRGLGDNWYLIFSNDMVGVEYSDAYDSSILPLEYSKSDTAVEDLSISLTKDALNAAFNISWGVHRFDSVFSLPPVKN